MENLDKELILGTANFNHLYTLSQKPKFRATELLTKAYENGIRTLDISNSYVNSYKYIAESNIDWSINAKIVLEQHKSSLDYEIKLKVIEIFEQMPKIKISNLMIHNLTDVSSFSINEVSSALRKVTEEFGIKNVGISIYPEQFSKISSENFDVIQLPVNVLDQRIFKENIRETFLRRRTQFHARSIYLRGLLTPASQFFESKARLDSKSVTSFKDWCLAEDLNSSFVCMNFVYHLNFVTHIIFGADDVNELKENIDYFNKSKVTKIQVPYKKFASTNLKLIDPRYWDR